MIYTYSPNWYKPQCLHFKANSLYYCSNYLLYEYDLQTKKVVQELCFRQVAIQQNLNHKDIKITSITSDEQTLFIGLNQPYMIRLEKSNFALLKVINIQTFQTVEYIYLHKDQQQQFAIICNKDGNMLKYLLNQEINPFSKIQVKYKLSSIKAIYKVDDHHCLIFTRGTILIYNKHFNLLQKMIEVSSHDSIYSVDSYRNQQLGLFFAFLIKNKENYSIFVFQFQYRQQFPLEFKKKLEQISLNIKKFHINFYYPKKFSQKLKSAQKASLSLKLLNANQLIITGKLGQINTLHLQHIKQDQNISLKPYSYNQQEIKEYQTWTDSRHYKEIYCIYKHQNRLYIISTDHNMTIWQHQHHKDIKYLYTIKFLTSSIQQFFYSESDPRNIFALLKDSAIRSFTPLDEGSHQLNQFWKFSKKYKIKKAVNHPYEQGIVGLASQCNAVQLYDLYEDRLFKLIQIGQQILNISFQYPSIKPELQTILKYEFKPQKYKNVSYPFKQIQNKTILLVQTKSNFIVITNLGLKDIICYVGKRQKRLQRIHQNRYWDERMLLSSQSKNNILNVFIRYQKVDINLPIEVNYQQGRFLFKNPKQSKILFIINFKGTKFTIFKTQILPEQSKCQVTLRSQLIYCQPIDYFFINYKDQRVALYSQKDNTIMILHLNNIIEDKYELMKNCQQVEIYSINSKVDTLIFYLEKYLIVGSKDQDIKVIKYDELPLVKHKEIKQKQLIQKKQNLEKQ